MSDELLVVNILPYIYHIIILFRHAILTLLITVQVARSWLLRLPIIDWHKWPKLTPGLGTDDKDLIQFRNKITNNILTLQGTLHETNKYNTAININGCLTMLIIINNL